MSRLGDLNKSLSPLSLTVPIRKMGTVAPAPIS